MEIGIRIIHLEGSIKRINKASENLGLEKQDPVKFYQNLSKAVQKNLTAGENLNKEVQKKIKDIL